MNYFIYTSHQYMNYFIYTSHYNDTYGYTLVAWQDFSTGAR